MDIESDEAPPATPFTSTAYISYSGTQYAISFGVALDEDALIVAERLVRDQRVPFHLLSSLQSTLSTLMSLERTRREDEKSRAALEAYRAQPAVVIDRLVRRFHDEHERYADARIPDEFSELYHSLIHSPSCLTLLQLEEKYAFAVSEVLQGRDRAVAVLGARQQRELERMLESQSQATTRDAVNQLTGRHLEEMEMLQVQWASELSALKATQRRDYRQFVISQQDALREQSAIVSQKQQQAVMEYYARPSGGGIATSGTGALRHDSVTSASATTSSLALGPQASLEGHAPRENPVQIEESFTIHLGTQLKMTQNIRLVSGAMLDLCRWGTQQQGDVSAQRAQTAMTLYSRSLSALVLCVEKGFSYGPGTRRDFATLCEQSTDFHFADLDQQMVGIERDFGELQRGEAGEGQGAEGNVMQETGDVYVTRHSNLASFHVAFHLAVDHEVTKASLSSRSAVVAGLRNVLFSAFQCDCRNITLPLLLVHILPDSASPAWCLRRAELVLKCVKGFMMETHSWGNTDERTVQFILPPDLPEGLFASISNLVTSVFRETTALELGK